MCINQMVLEADSGLAVERALASMLDGAGQFDFGRLIPMPAVLKVSGTAKSELRGGGDGEVARSVEEQAEIERIGFDSWYDWATAHWGTKWNAWDTQVDLTELESGKAAVTYQTAWAPPEPVLAKLRETHPDVRFAFRCRYDEDEDDDGYPYGFPHEVTI